MKGCLRFYLQRSAQEACLQMDFQLQQIWCSMTDQTAQLRSIYIQTETLADILKSFSTESG